MLTSFLKSFEGASLINSLKPDKPIDFERLLAQVLEYLKAAVEDGLGEEGAQEAVMGIGTKVAQTRELEDSLIETKERYNALVEKSSSIFLQARRIGAAVASLITSLNTQLQSEQFLIPVKQIQKGIGELTPEKVEKQCNYLGKLFENAFDEALHRRISIVEGNIEQELLLAKNIHKHLEAELALHKPKSPVDGKPKSPVQCSPKQELTDYEEKLRTAESKVLKLTRSLMERSNELATSQSLLQKMRINQQEVMDELQGEARRKEGSYQASISKSCIEKSALQEQVRGLQQKVAELEKSLLDKDTQLLEAREAKQGIALSRESEADIGSMPSILSESLIESPQKKPSYKELKLALGASEDINRGLQEQLKGMVDRGLMRELFISYDDESKEWTVRKNIKKQLQTLLGMEDQHREETQPSTKWFGLF